MVTRQIEADAAQQRQLPRLSPDDTATDDEVVPPSMPMETWDSMKDLERRSRGMLGHAYLVRGWPQTPAQLYMGRLLEALDREGVVRIARRVPTTGYPSDVRILDGGKCDCQLRAFVRLFCGGDPGAAGFESVNTRRGRRQPLFSPDYAETGNYLLLRQ